MSIDYYKYSDIKIRGNTYNQWSSFKCYAQAAGNSECEGTGKSVTKDSLTVGKLYYIHREAVGSTVKYPYAVATGTTIEDIIAWFPADVFPYATYTITYNANGGSGAPASHSYTYATSGTTNLSSTIPTRTGYTFLGWSLSSTATTASYTAGQYWNLSNASDYTLYAVWQINTYTVTYNANGGAGTMAKSTVTYNSSFKTTQNTFTRSGYTFNGWNEKANGTGTAWALTDEGVYESGKSRKWTYDKHITLYAQWLPNMYHMILDCQGGKTQDGEESVQYNAIFDSFVGGLNYGQSLPIPIRLGYNFIGWNDKENGKGVYYTGSETMNAVGGMILYAIWEPAASLVTIQINGQPRRGMMHMYDDNGQLCYAIMTIYDEDGNGHYTC